MGKVRLTLIGPMPPPIHGQAVVTRHIRSALESEPIQIKIADTSEGRSHRWLRPLVKIWRAVRATWSIPGSDSVYIAVNAGNGMWLTLGQAAVARLVGASIFLHHHSYSYVRQRRLRMIALVRAAGPRAHHILLSRTMARELLDTMPEIRQTLVVGNAGLVDTTLLELPLKEDGGEIVLGHLSNLCLEKGIAEVVDLAVGLQQSGTAVRLIVGGPAVDMESRAHLSRAAKGLGDLFEYRGLLTGEAKRGFFREVTHFVFPSRYVHEAVPLVIFEAMAAGAVCVATRWGSIPEQLEGSPGMIAQSNDSFVTEVLPMLTGTSPSKRASQESRDAYLSALSDSQKQVEHLIAMMCASSRSLQ